MKSRDLSGRRRLRTGAASSAGFNSQPVLMATGAPYIPDTGSVPTLEAGGRLIGLM